MKVAVIERCEPKKLEDAINEFIGKGYKIISMQYQAVAAKNQYGGSYYYSVLIQYCD